MYDYEGQLQLFIKSALAEDIGSGDVTTLCCIPPEIKGKAVLKIKQSGVLAGMGVAEAIFRFLCPDIGMQAFLKDGDPIKDGDVAFEVGAPAAVILQCERLVLNCMQRMSGIATLTRLYTARLQNYHTRILDTRKTTPNFRLLEKEAVHIGGGLNHRFGLFDMILLKDNHIDFCGGIENAIEKAWSFVTDYMPGMKIEVETRSLADVKKALKAGRGKVNRIMLDNFSPDQIREALEMIQGAFETEASGGINLDNLTAFADTGVDYISTGAVIHQATSIDLSLKALI